MATYTILYESVNGGIYEGKDETFVSTDAAQHAIRKGLPSSYFQTFIADETGRRVLRGYRTGRTWAFDAVATITRVELHDALVKMMGYEDTAHAFTTIDECGEFPFDRHDAYGILHYSARHFGDGAYALYKVP